MVELVTLGLVLGLETGFGRGFGIGLVSYKSIFTGKKSRFIFELAHSLDSRIQTKELLVVFKVDYCSDKSHIFQLN